MAAKYAHVDEHGRYQRAHGRRYYLKGGKPFDSVWDIPSIAPTARERAGYPTQKPLALLERVMRRDHGRRARSSSTPSSAAARRPSRRSAWAAASSRGDSSPQAIAVTCGRLEREAQAQPAPDVLLSRP